jgi:hypothetical protein
MMALATIAVAEIVQRSTTILYTPDEIINLDAAITFFRSGDYTTEKWQSIPFDPAISSGLLATWMDGLVFLSGGNLFHARVVRAVAHLGIAVFLTVVFLRSKSLRTPTAVVLALVLWLAVVVIPHHAERIVGPGEIWGFLYGVAGVLVARSHPVLATMLWGAATWLCKLIYLPFTLALLAAQIVSLGSEQRIDFRSRQCMRLVSIHTAAFLAPLALWMSIIWLQYDLETLVRWSVSYVTFAFTHSTGLEMDTPGLQGWRFSPGWPEAQSLLRYSSDITLPYLIPLALAPLFVAGHALLRRGRMLRSTLRKRYFLTAALVAVAVVSLWFFALDPTQWGRHLMTAVYVSIAISVYCAADIWQQEALPRASVIGVVVVCFAFVVYRTTADVIERQRSEGWKMSFAATCHGLDLVRPPCRQDEARQLIAAECGDNFTCIQERREQFLRQAQALAEGSDATLGAAYTAGFLVILVQHECYSDRREFERDFGPLLCAADDPVFRSYLEEAGLEVAALLRRCEPSQHGDSKVPFARERGSQTSGAAVAKEFRHPAPSSSSRRFILATKQFHAEVVGNEHGWISSDGGLNGIAALIPRDSDWNIFVPALSGLNFEQVWLAGVPPTPFAPRRQPAAIESDGSSVVLTWREMPHTGIAARITFSVREPWYLDQTVELTAHRSFVGDGQSNHLAAIFASSIQQPQDHHVYLRPSGVNGAPLSGWYGVTTATAHDQDYLLRPLPEHRLEVADHLAAMETQKGVDIVGPSGEVLLLKNLPLHFYYGLLRDNLVFLQMFKQPDLTRFLYNLDGGDLLGTVDKRDPAWGYVFHHPDVQIGESYRWNTCIVVKPFRGREDILREVRKYMADR